MQFVGKLKFHERKKTPKNLLTKTTQTKNKNPQKQTQQNKATKPHPTKKPTHHHHHENTLQVSLAVKKVSLKHTPIKSA